jgi:hypothetical protein
MSLRARHAQWLWGYDFFISYHWASGGAYAVALAGRLRDRNYDVFLDRAEYAMGDPWRSVGERALRNTQRLVLVATREAVTQSEPVAHEVKAFTARGRQVIPVVFFAGSAEGNVSTLADLDRQAHPTLGHIPDSQLYIEEDAANLPRGPSEAVVDQLVRTHRVMRRRNVRAALLGVVAAILIAFLAFAVASWGNAEVERGNAVQAADSERIARLQEKKQRTIAEQRATDLTTADGYRLIQLGSEQLAAWKTEQAAASFLAAQRSFGHSGHSPVMAWYRRLAAELASLSKERLFQTRRGRNVRGLHVSDDGALVALVFEYNEIPAEELKTAPAVEVWDTASRQLVVMRPVLSDLGKQVSRYWSQDEHIDNRPGKEIEGVLPPCDLILRKTDKTVVTRERLSLRDGSRTPYDRKMSPEDAQHLAGLRRLPLNVKFDNTSLTFQPRHAGGNVSISGFFGRDPVTGNDRMYRDPFGERPDLLRAESFDGGRLLVGSYEGTVALFECDTYGTQLRRGRIGPIRGIKYIGKSRNAIAVDEKGTVWRLSEDHPAVARTGLKHVAQLAFAANGAALATVSHSTLAAYDVNNKRVIAQHDFGSPPDERLAFGHSQTRRAVYAIYADGTLRALEYDRPDKPGRRATIRYAKDPKPSVDRLVRACFDVDHDLVWIASANRDKDNVSLVAYALANPEAPVHTQTLELGEVEDLGPVARRGNEVLLFVAARKAPGVKELDGVTLLVRFKPDAKSEPTYTRAFKPHTERYYNDWRGRIPSIKRFLDAPPDEGTYVEVDLGSRSGVYPLGTPMNLDRHRFVGAAAGALCRDRGANLAITVTGKSGVDLTITSADRDLSYRMPLPVTGFLSSCAITRNGQLVAVAAGGEDVVVIDLSVFAKLRE